jgi:AAA domain (dynein-related subfamily)
MKPSKVEEVLPICIKAKRPVFLWGQPGAGKSELIASVGKSLEYGLTDLRAVLLDPVDLRGLPAISDTKDGKKEAVWCPPSFLPKGKKPHILFLDELNAAPPLVQAACYQLVLNRRVGEYVLPDETVVIAAGNRETDKAVTSRMASPLANRFVHINFDVDNDDWIRWALRNGVRQELIAFQRFRPHLITNFDPKRNDKAFSTPRSITFLSQLMEANGGVIDYELAQGTVGEGYAAEFIGFLRVYQNLPDPDAIIMRPDKGEVPRDPATLFALCEALAHRASDQTIANIVTYANRLEEEFSVLLIRDCIDRDETLVRCRPFIDWSSKHADVLY